MSTTSQSTETSIESVIVAATRLIQNGKFSDAYALSEPFVDLNPANPRLLRIAAYSAEKTDLLPVAEKINRKRLSLEPENLLAQFELAKVVFMQKRVAEAYDILINSFRKWSGKTSSDDAIFAAIEALIKSRKNTLFELKDHLTLYSLILKNSDASDSWLLRMVDYISCLISERSLHRDNMTLVFELIRFKKSNSFDWLEHVFRKVVFPCYRNAIGTGDVNLALVIESEMYANYVSKLDTQAHFTKSMNNIIESQRKAGTALRQRTRYLEKPVSERAEKKIVFFLHNDLVLAHTEVLLSMLEGAVGLKDFKPIIAIRQSVGEKFDAKAAKFGVPVIRLENFVESAGYNILESYEYLKGYVANNNVDAVVFVSVANHMAFAFALRLAPIQIWWSMKYHSISIPEIDDYVTNGSFERRRQIENRSWHVVHSALSGLYDPSLVEQALLERKRFPDKCRIIGCMGRAEKMEDPQFLELIARTLKQRPNTIFLWTGREKTPAIKNYFESQGIADRCHFIGWVNTRLYAQVIDIYADTFPFGGGHTIFQSWAAGKPAVIRLTPETIETGIPTHILPVLNGTAGTEQDQRDIRQIFSSSAPLDLLPFVQTEQEYFDRLIQLIDDPALRRKWGDAGQQFVERYMANTKRMAESFSTVLDEIIAAKREQTIAAEN